MTSCLYKLFCRPNLTQLLKVAFADKILLNKIDLVTAAEKAEVKKTIRSINAVAKVTVFFRMVAIFSREERNSFC